MSKVKDMMMEAFKKTFSGRDRRGFSAVEILAVATIIAILSLILIPILRGRVSSSRVTAARWEMNKMAQQVTLAEADTGSWVRLQDLDNTDVFTPYTDANYDPNLHVPSAVIQIVGRVGFPSTEAAVQRSGDLSEARRTALAQSWSGPYISMPNSKSILDLRNLYPLVVGNAVTAPIVAQNDNSIHDEDAGLYPLDPWGNPYFLFVETALGGNVIYSMGPNGVPGIIVSPVTSNYFPKIPGLDTSTDGALGEEDDLIWKF